MKESSLLGGLVAFYLLILAATIGCFYLIGFKLDGILLFELVGSLLGIAGCGVISVTESRRRKQRQQLTM